MLKKERYDNIEIVVKPNSIFFTSPTMNGEKPLVLSVYEIRRQLNNIGFICPYNQFNKSEYLSAELERYGIPFMNFIYYYELFRLQRIPTFEEFYNGYLYFYCDKTESGTYKIKDYFDDGDFSFTENQLKGRVFRSYNSFHREIEFLMQMGSKPGVDIHYSFQDDLKGIDFTVKLKGKIFGLASYISTSKSQKWKYQKNTVRHDYSDIEMIDVVAKWLDDDIDKNCDSVNGIYVYSPGFVETKYQEMLEKCG